MTIQEALAMCDAIKPNSFTYAEKVRWLSELDGMVNEEIINTHTDTPTAFSGYSAEEAPNTSLLIPYPYSGIYIHYLHAQIDLFSGELAKYNNSITLYNNAYLTYQDYYNRKFMPSADNKLEF